MIKLKLIILCIFSLSLLAEEEFSEVLEGTLDDTQYEEVGVISEPTILEYTNMDNIEDVTFESEKGRVQEQVVAPSLDAVIIPIVPTVESNLSTVIVEKESPIYMTYDEALKVAKESNKIILLDVVADKCPFCKKMEEQVLSKDVVQEAIKKDFILAQVNEDKEPLPLGLSPQMTPSFIFITKTESIEDMRFGFIPQEKFLELLAEEKAKIK